MSICSACKNFRAQHPLRAEIQSPEKCALWWVNTHVNNFLVCAPKFTRFLLGCALGNGSLGGVVVDQLLFRFSICGSVPEIFAIKVESCQKSRKILDGILPSQILGGRPPKNCTQVITPGSQHVVWINICDDIPISSEVIDVYTLNFKLKTTAFGNSQISQFRELA